ncbi:MAG: Gfo/Idh/MocA family oxidoreductase [Planctomycetota bacterium]|nr:MAG: Gfo/Idh/MocA family oxidoreductase [Planctomycetota bacterium]
MMHEKSTRRVFLYRTAPAAIGTSLIGSRILAAEKSGRLGANEVINVAVIGCGIRGPHHIREMKKIEGVRIVALCDLHKGRLAEALKKAEGAKPYHDYRRIIDDKDIDAVLVATNDHWHVLPAIHACQAGKDVYIEKPVGTAVNEGQALINAADKYDRVVVHGTQQRSTKHYQEAVKIIRSGVLGEISEVHCYDFENFYPGFGCPPDGPPPPELDWEFYVGPCPRAPYNPNRYAHHYWFFHYGGGWQLDWAVHHYDIVHWAMGVDAPITAMGLGDKFAFESNTQWPDTFNGACEYPPGPVAKRGFLMTYIYRGNNYYSPMGSNHGKVFYGDNAALILSRRGYQIKSQTRNGKQVVEEKALAASHDYETSTASHLRHFFDCVRTREKSYSNIEIGHRASNPGHLMNIAWRVGRKIRWDAAKELVIDDAQANTWLTKHYRKPWTLPT